MSNTNDTIGQRLIEAIDQAIARGEFDTTEECCYVDVMAMFSSYNWDLDTRVVAAWINKNRVVLPTEPCEPAIATLDGRFLATATTEADLAELKVLCRKISENGGAIRLRSATARKVAEMEQVLRERLDFIAPLKNQAKADKERFQWVITNHLGAGSEWKAYDRHMLSTKRYCAALSTVDHFQPFAA